jgi:hypothetical protein
MSASFPKRPSFRIVAKWRDGADGVDKVADDLGEAS